MFRSLVVLASLGIASAADAAFFLVTNNNASGVGSLAKAISDANLTAVADTVQFAVPGGGVIAIGGTLPPITKPLTIDGYTQTGSGLNTTAVGGTNAFIRIQLDAFLVATGDALIRIEAGPTLIRGLAIVGMPVNTYGIEVIGGVTGVKIEGCFIGVHADGNSDGSSGTGILADGIATFIGGTTLGTRNLISGNDRAGIELAGALTVVQNNVIGLNAVGDSPLPNGSGILVMTGALDNRIGFTTPNLIAGNDNDGIRISANAVVTTRIEGNRIRDNGGLGIDLNNDGVTPNDPGDTDSGPNDLQNYPELTYATLDGSTLHVEGHLDSPAGHYRLEFFAVESPDPSGFGEGDVFLGSVEAEPSESPFFFRYQLALDTELPEDFQVTATAQNTSLHESSEFSRAIEVVNGGHELVVTNNFDAGAGSLRAAILSANADAVVNTIVFDRPLIQPIQPQTPYTILQDVIVDGYSQPGAKPNTSTRGSNAQIRVEIDGSQLSGNASVFSVSNADATFRGLVIHSAPGSAIFFNNTRPGAVEGCFLGTNVAGTADFGNGISGIHGGATSGLRIGGDQPARRNVISGNELNGITLTRANARIQGNVIGANALGFAALGNTHDGISVRDEYVQIGDDTFQGQGQNLILFNGGFGIGLTDTVHTVTILGNEIASNGSLGITLGEGTTTGVTFNDLNDADSGGNSRQNFPVLTSVVALPGELQLSGFLDVPSAANMATYTIRVFANEECDASGHGEGEVFLGAREVLLSGSDETFEISLPFSINDGIAITTTATDEESAETSEFSECIITGEVIPLCGDATLDDNLTTSDALLILRTSVGAVSCELCVCDVNSSGAITTADALQTLRSAVGQPLILDCPACS